MKPLAVSSPTPLLPTVPTTEQEGLSFPSFGWWGMVAPKGTPQPIIDKLAKVLIEQTKDPKFAEYMQRQAVRPSGMPPAEFAAFMKQDRERAKIFFALANAPMKDYKPPEQK